MWGELDLSWEQTQRWPHKEGAWKLLCHRPGSLDRRAGSMFLYSSSKSFLSEIQLSFMCTLSCSEVALLKLSSGQIDSIFLVEFEVSTACLSHSRTPTASAFISKSSQPEKPSSSAGCLLTLAAVESE